MSVSSTLSLSKISKNLSRRSHNIHLHCFGPKIGVKLPIFKKIIFIIFFYFVFFFSFENYIHFYLFWLWYAIIIQNVQNMSPITTSRYLIGLFLTQNWVKMASLFNRNLSRKFVHATFVGLWYPIIMPNLNSCKSSM